MPGMDGIETTAALRAQAELGEVPIVITTGEGGARDWRIAQERGASAFVVKPFDPLSFIATLRAVLVRSEQGVPLVSG